MWAMFLGPQNLPIVDGLSLVKEGNMIAAFIILAIATIGAILVGLWLGEKAGDNGPLPR